MQDTLFRHDQKSNPGLPIVNMLRQDISIKVYVSISLCSHICVATVVPHQRRCTSWYLGEFICAHQVFTYRYSAPIELKRTEKQWRRSENSNCGIINYRQFRLSWVIDNSEIKPFLPWPRFEPRPSDYQSDALPKCTIVYS